MAGESKIYKPFFKKRLGYFLQSFCNFVIYLNLVIKRRENGSYLILFFIKFLSFPPISGAEDTDDLVSICESDG